jgi:uncharacterized protein (DUF1501 family)
MNPIDENLLGTRSDGVSGARIYQSRVTRREFMHRAAVLSAAGIVLLSPHAWAAGASGERKGRLVVVFLRGAVDGLNVVVPHAEPAYYDARPTIAIGRLNSDGGVQDLDGFFGLHPALAPLMPLWSERTLAFVHACGSPDPTRSHFDAQDYMESGTPGIKSTHDGWLNRVLAQLPGGHAPTEALSLGPTLPRILSGKLPVANLPLGRAAARPLPLDRPMVETAFDRLYGGADALSVAYREGRASRAKLLTDLQRDMVEADAGAPLPQGFSDDTGRLAHLIRRDPSIRVAFMALGGWDTHVSQGAAQGQLAAHLAQLAGGLSGFAKALGPEYQDTVVLVISEFGRTVKENGNGGTDHGHGNVLWMMGGPVRGGKVYGRWPGLATSALYQERDLAVTTDFRQPIGALLRSHLALSDTQVAQVFPGAPATRTWPDSIIRS